MNRKEQLIRDMQALGIMEYALNIVKAGVELNKILTALMKFLRNRRV